MKGQNGCVPVSKARFETLQWPGWACTAIAQVRRWRELGRQRTQLATLGDEALKDLGLSRADIAMETERPFWDDPLRR